MREIRDFSGGWRLYAKSGDEKFSNSAIALPFVCGGEGLCAVTLENEWEAEDKDAGQTVYLELSYLCGEAEAFIDGEPAKAFCGGRRAVITDSADTGKSYKIKIEIAPLCRADGRFTVGKISVTTLGRSHFSMREPGDGVSVKTELAGNEAVLHIKSLIENPNNYDIVSFSVSDSAGNTAAAKTAKPTQLDTELILPSPKLWGGQGDAELYRLQAVLQRDSTMLDSVEISFGIKSAALDSSGLFRLNAVPLPLNGIEISDCAMIKSDLELFSLCEANAVLAQSLPVKTDLLSECDRSGTVFWYKAASGGDTGIRALRYFLSKNRHHPSLTAAVCPAMADEKFREGFIKAVRECTDGVFTVIELESGFEGALPQGFDIALINVRLQEKDGFMSAVTGGFERLRSENPGMRFAVSASAAAELSESAAARLHELMWNMFFKEKAITAYFAGLLTDTPAEKSCHGLVSADRKTPRDAFWFYKSRFSAHNFIKICLPAEKPCKKKLDIYCYSNVLPLKLLVNKKSKKRYVPVEIYGGSYVFRRVKIKRKNNLIEISGADAHDTAEIYYGK